MGVRAQVIGKRAIFLDRDGVLNEPVVRDGKPYPPNSVESMTISPGAGEALTALKELGFLLIVVSNQPDVRRGTRDVSDVERLNAALATALPVDAFFMCYHDDVDSCDCRKPRPGLLLRAASQYGIELKTSFMIGDRWRDIAAGQAADCTTVWIDRGYAERLPDPPPAARVSSISDAARWIVDRIQA
jgi:D-glycero-D-manno-heptose 1,7-bisphosphate phosphatase